MRRLLLNKNAIHGTAKIFDSIRAGLQFLVLKWPQFKKWLSRYAGLLSFLGTAFVVLTFIARDILRDEAKDLARRRLRPARRIRQFDCDGCRTAGFSRLARILERQDQREVNRETPE